MNLVSGLDRSEWEQQSKQIWREFLSKFPFEKISSLTLDEYCLGKGSNDSFSWWVEYGTRILGSICGGNCKKFLIYYPRNNNEGLFISKLLPQNAEVAFSQLKNFIFKIASLSREKDFETLKTLENELFGPAVFWKIAYLYQDQQNPWIYPVFSVSACRNLFGKSPLIGSVSEGQKNLSMKYATKNYWDSAFQINAILDNFMWLKAQDLAIQKGFEAVGGKDEGREETLKSQVFAHPDGCLFLITKASKDLKVYTTALGNNLQVLLKNNNVEVEAYSENKERASYLNNTKGLEEGNIIFKLTFSDFPSFEKFLEGYLIERLKKEGGYMSQSVNSEVNEIINLLNFKNNVIIQGAPGTGKTYLVPEVATRLCGKADSSTSREDVIKEFRKLQNEGRVIFCTFHPSFDYEDFVEGYKPREDIDNLNNNFSLEVRPGVIRKICERITARGMTTNNDSHQIIRDEVNVWKVSLAGTGENELRNKCLTQDCIAIGWTQYPREITDWECVKEGSKSLKAFYEKMQIGDVVVSCYSQTETDAIGIITGKPVWDIDFDEGYPRKLNVQWLYKKKKGDEPLNIIELNDGKNMTLSTIYKLTFSSERLRQFLEEKNLLKPDLSEGTSSLNKEPYILVIDEINRGNVSKIFGELITLLESDKRKGGISEVAITLPYSHKEFRLPPNLYILGTMNTADRSVGTLDYALRRRFAFFRAKPKKLDIPGFDEKLFNEVSSLFVSNLDDQIEPSIYLSPDYNPLDVCVGQSYFIVSANTSIQQRFHYEILPILEEYLADGILLPHAKERIQEIMNSLSD